MGSCSPSGPLELLTCVEKLFGIKQPCTGFPLFSSEMILVISRGLLGEQFSLIQDTENS